MSSSSRYLDANVYGQYVLRVIWVQGQPLSIRHSVPSYLTFHKTLQWQKLSNHAISLTKLQATSHSGEQPALYKKKKHKLHNRRLNRCEGTINNIGSSSNMSSRQSFNGKGIEGTSVSDEQVASFVKPTWRLVNSESRESFDSVPCCRDCKEQRHKLPKYPVVPGSSSPSSSRIPERILGLTKRWGATKQAKLLTLRSTFADQ